VFGIEFSGGERGQNWRATKADPRCDKADGDRLRGKPGGLPGRLGIPTEVLAYGLEKTDLALASMIQALKNQGLYQSTLFIVTAKHGQSPIDPRKTKTSRATSRTSWPRCPTPPAIPPPSRLRPPEPAPSEPADSSWTTNVAPHLAAGPAAGASGDRLFSTRMPRRFSIQYVLGGDSLKLKFNDPLTDSRTPDLFRAARVRHHLHDLDEEKRRARRLQHSRHQRRPDRLEPALARAHDQRLR